MMASELHTIEAYFKLDNGILKSLEENERFKSLKTVIERFYKKDLEFNQISDQLDLSLINNSQLKATINSLESRMSKIITEKDKVTHEYELLQKKDSECQDLAKTQLNELNSIKQKFTNIENELLSERNKYLKICDDNRELLQHIEVKNNQISCLNNEINEKNIKIKTLTINNNNLLNEIEIIKSNNTFDTNIHVEERLNVIQSQLYKTIEQCNERIIEKDNEIEKLKIEIKCAKKYQDVLKTDNILLKEHRSNIYNKLNEFNIKIVFIENDVKNMILSLEERVHIIEKYHKTQYDHTLEVNGKLMEYLSFINTLKLQVQNLELDKNNLIAQLNDLQNETMNREQEYENKLNLSNKQLELMQSFSCDDSNTDDTRLLGKIIEDKQLLAHMSPIAVNTSKVMTTGFTLTDIYSEYVKEHKEYLSLKHENSLALSQIKNLIQELGFVKKSLNEQLKDNQGLIEVNSTMSQRLNDARVQILDLNMVIKEANNKKTQLELDIKKLNDVKYDLNGQLQHLLAKYENLYQQLPANIQASLDDKNTPTSLPFYTSIAELQSVNTRLLEMIHELETEAEQLNQKNIDLSLNESSKVLSEKHETLETELRQTSKMLEVTTQQRDMYRMLYQQKSGLSISNTEIHSFVHQSESLETSLVELNRVRAAYTDVKQRLDQTLKKLDEYQTASQSEINELKNSKLKYIANVDEIQQKYKILKEENKMIKNNYDAVEKKCQSFEEIYSSLEQTCNQLRQERDTLRTEFENVRYAHRSIIVECDSFKTSIKRLECENQILREHSLNSHPLLLEFQQISSQLSNLDILTKNAIPTQIANIREELNSLRVQTSALSVQFDAEKIQLCQNFDNIKKELQKERISHQNTAEKLQFAYDRIESMKISHDSFTFDADHHPEQVKIIIDNLKSDIVDLETQIKQYKLISEASENKLSQLISEHSNLRETFINEQNKWKSLEKSYQQRIEEITSDLNVYKNAIDPNASQANSYTDEYLKKVEELTESLQNMSKQYDAAVVGHSETIKRLKEAQIKVREDEKIIFEQNQKISELQTDLKVQIQKIHDKDVDLEKWEQKRQEDEALSKQQMEVLYDQIKSLRDQISSIPADLSFSQNKYKDDSECPIDTSSDVWKLLEFTRRDKAILQGRLEFAQNECARLVTKCGQLQESYKNLENSLQVERDVKYSSVSSPSDLSSYRDTLKNLEKLSVEKLELETRLASKDKTELELKQNMEKLNGNYESLREKYNHLEKTYDEVNEKSDQLVRQRDILQRKCLLLTDKLNKINSDNSLVNKYNDLLDVHSKCSNQIEEAINNQQTYLQQIANLKEQLMAVKTTLAQKLAEMEKLKAIKQDEMSHVITSNQLSTDQSEKPENVQIESRVPITFQTSDQLPVLKRIINPTNKPKQSVSMVKPSTETQIQSTTPVSLVAVDRRIIVPPNVVKTDDIKMKTQIPPKTGSIRPSISRNILNLQDIISVRSTIPSMVTPSEITNPTFSNSNEQSDLPFSGKRVSADTEESRELGEIIDEIPTKRRPITRQDNVQPVFESLPSSSQVIESIEAENKIIENVESNQFEFLPEHTSLETEIIDQGIPEETHYEAEPTSLLMIEHSQLDNNEEPIEHEPTILIQTETNEDKNPLELDNDL